VVRAIGDSGDPRASEWIAPLTRSPHAVVAVAAIEVMGASPSRARVSVLLEASSSPEVEVVKAALLALEGVSDARVAQCLQRSLSHPAWDVRRLAADCIGRFGTEGAASVLRAHLAEEQEAIVREAIGRALAVVEAPATLRRPATLSPPKADP